MVVLTKESLKYLEFFLRGRAVCGGELSGVGTTSLRDDAGEF